MKKGAKSEEEKLEARKRLVVEVVKDEDNVAEVGSRDDWVEVENSPTSGVVGMSGSDGLAMSGDSGRDNNGSGLLMVAVIALLILSVTGWVMYIRSEWMRRQELELSSKQTEAVEQVVQEPVIESQTEMVESEQLERDEISLEILNGSGVAGLAAETKVIFEDLGYGEIEVGNFEATLGNELYVRAGYEDRVDVLMDDVLAELEIATISGVLESDGEIIARIVLGQQ